MIKPKLTKRAGTWAKRCDNRRDDKEVLDYVAERAERDADLPGDLVSSLGVQAVRAEQRLDAAVTVHAAIVRMADEGAPRNERSAWHVVKLSEARAKLAAGSLTPKAFRRYQAFIIGCADETDYTRKLNAEQARAASEVTS